MTEEDLQTMENLIRSALACICVDEYRPAINDLAQALALIDEYL